MNRLLLLLSIFSVILCRASGNTDFSFVYGAEVIGGVDGQCTYYHPEILITLPDTPYIDGSIYEADISVSITEDKEIYILSVPKRSGYVENLNYYKSFLISETKIEYLSSTEISLLLNQLKEIKEDTAIYIEESSEEDLNEWMSELQAEEMRALKKSNQLIEEILETDPKEGIRVTKYGYQLSGLFKNTPDIDTIIKIINDGIKIKKINYEIVKMLVLEYEMLIESKTENKDLFIIKCDKWPKINPHID